MRWWHRWWRGLAVAALAVAMLGSGFAAGTVRAGDPDQVEKTNYRDIYYDALAAALQIDRTTMDHAMRQAALETVQQAVLNEDLTQKQGDQISACIQKEEGSDFMGCYYRHRYHHGDRHHGQGKERDDDAEKSEPAAPRSQPGAPSGQPNTPSSGGQQQQGGW